MLQLTNMSLVVADNKHLKYCTQSQIISNKCVNIIANIVKLADVLVKRLTSLMLPLWAHGKPIS